VDRGPDGGVAEREKLSTLYPAGLEEILRRIVDHEKHGTSAGAPPVDGRPARQTTTCPESRRG
jgi:hypothetical protein